MYRTTDGGNSWGLVADLSEYHNGSFNYSPFVLEAKNSVVYFPKHGTTGDCADAVVISEDRGETWETSEQFPVLGLGTCPFLYALSIQDDLLLCLIGYPESTIWNTINLARSNDFGQSWNLVGPVHTQSYLAASADGQTLYTSGYQVHISEDGGYNWINVGSELVEERNYLDIDMSSQNPNTVFVTYGGGLHDGRAILKSENGGQDWVKLGDADIIGRGQHFGEVLRVNPYDDDYVYIAIPGIFTTDGGETWAQLEGPDYISEGMVSIAFNPGNDQEMLFGYHIFEGGLFRSPDMGYTIQPRGLGADFQINTIAYSPSDNQIIYVVADVNDETGLYRSNDGGVAWELVSVLDQIGFLDGETKIDLYVDPRDSATLYLSRGTVFVSHDGGLKWSSLNLGLSPYESFRDMVLVPNDPPILFGVGVSGVWKLELP